jgi:hypothetical protein
MRATNCRICFNRGCAQVHDSQVNSRYRDFSTVTRYFAAIFKFIVLRADPSVRPSHAKLLICKECSQVRKSNSQANDRRIVDHASRNHKCGEGWRFSDA